MMTFHDRLPDSRFGTTRQQTDVQHVRNWFVLEIQTVNLLLRCS